MHVIGWILTGALVGLLAAALGTRRFGIAGHLVLGALGGALGGVGLRILHLAPPALSASQVVVAAAASLALVLALRAAVAAAARRAPGAVALPREMFPALEARLARAAAWERDLFTRLLPHASTARDVGAEFEGRMTLGERVADRVATFGGSWTFLGGFFLALLVWIAWNVELPGSFDPYPFILLNLVLSCLAAIQAPVIMMSQNRMAAKDRLEAHSDYQVNLKAELEILALHEKLDELRARAWADLIALQQQQIAALERLERRLERHDSSDA
jgi:uncharacterized membrane protein/uncharacterized membrane protein YeaQ/YmgE (transglycosylase-associated protein family)